MQVAMSSGKAGGSSSSPSSSEVMLAKQRRDEDEDEEERAMKRLKKVETEEPPQRPTNTIPPHIIPRNLIPRNLIPRNLIPRTVPTSAAATDLIRTSNPILPQSPIDSIHSNVIMPLNPLSSSDLPPSASSSSSTNLLSTNLLSANLLSANLLSANLLSSNLLSSNVIPSNVIPSNVIPSNAIPSNAITSNLLSLSPEPANIIQTDTFQAGRKSLDTVSTNEGTPPECSSNTKPLNDAKTWQEMELAKQEWREHKTIVWRDYATFTADRHYVVHDFEYGSRILAMDLDGTLITTRSGKVFPVDEHDWRLWANDSIILSRIRSQVFEQGMKLAVFSNQKGISLGKVEKSGLVGKVDALQRRLCVPMQAFVMTADDCFRKPCRTTWDFMAKHCNNGVEIDYENSVFIGDGAGRPWNTFKRKRDYTSSDLKFAINVGIKFATPDNFFYSKPDDSVPTSFSFDPRKLVIPTPGEATPLWAAAVKLQTTYRQEVVMMVGPPSSGKTTLAQLLYHTYAQVNQDVLKTRDKCLQAFRKHLTEGQSVVVDNQNRDVNSRKAYLDLVKTFAGCRVRAIHFVIPKDMCMHLGAFRTVCPRLSSRIGSVSDEVMNSYYINCVPPQTAEGFHEVVTVTPDIFVIGPFANDEEQSLFTQFLTS